jgi:hypothetical protein
MLTKKNPTTGSVIAAVVHDLLDADRFETEADLVDALKFRLARYRIRWTNDAIAHALRIVATTRPLVGAPAPPPPRPEPPDEAPTFTPAEIVEFLQHLYAMPKVMPKAITISQGQADRIKALRMVVKEIAATEARCDALEGTTPNDRTARPRATPDRHPADRGHDDDLPGR